MSNEDAPENMPKSLQDVEDYSPDKVPATDDFALEGTLFLIPPLTTIQHGSPYRPELGYEAQLKREFGLFQLVASAFTVTNSWLGIAAGFTTGITAAGPAGIIYGMILMFVINIFVGISLSELISAMPTSSGQYYWAMTLAPKKLSRASGYITGVCNIFGAYCITASTSIGVSMMVFGCIKLAIPELYVF